MEKIEYFQYIDEYIEFKQLKKESTKKLYRRSILKFKGYCDIKQIKVLSFQSFNTLIDDFQTYLKNTYEDGTIRTTSKIVINYFNYLNDNDKLDGYTNTYKIIDNDEVSEEKIISSDEFEIILEYLENKYEYIHMFLFMVAYYCGLKTKYLKNVKFDDFVMDYDNSFYFYNNIFHIHPCKIYLPERMKKIYLKIKSENIHIFVNKKGNLFNDRYITRLFEKTCTNAGINKYAPKDFRHTCIFNYIKENGIDDVDLKFNWARNNIDRMYSKILNNNKLNMNM